MTSKPPRDALQRFIERMLAGGVLALAGLAFFSQVQYTGLKAAVELAQGSREAIAAVQGAGRELENADAALLDYLLTGYPGALAACVTGMAAAERRLGETAQRVDSGADQQASLRHLQDLGAQKLAELRRIIALPDARFALGVVQTVRDGEARQRLADLGSVVATMAARERSLLDQRSAEAYSRRDRVQYLSWLTQLGMVLVFCGGWFVVRRELRARVVASDALRQSQRELEASEQRIRSMANALPALIGYVDRSETYRFTNCRYETFFGAPAGSFTGKTVRDLLGAQAYASTKARVAAVLAGTPQTFERPNKLQGRDAHALVNYVPDRDADGNVAGFYVMVLDITDRKNAEMAQQVNERRFRAITDNVPAIIAHLDRDHRYLHASEGFRRVWGADPNGLIGRTLRDFRGEAVYAQLAEHLLGVLQGETRRLELREVIDGIERHFQQSLVPDIDAEGRVQGYYSVAFDITDLRRNEMLLMQSSARHRSIVEEQAELVSLARPDGEVIYANPSYARHFGLVPAALVGMNLFDFVAAADRDVVRATVASVIETGVMASSENRMIGTDGQEIWVAWTNTLQRDSSGVATLRSVGRDVTEQRRAEQALRASEEFLGRTGRLAGVGGYEIDIESGRIFWSKEVCRVHDVPEGHVPTIEEAIGFYVPEAQPLFRDAVRRGIETGASWDLELRLVTATGRQIWVRAVGDVEFEHGQAVRIVGAFQDVTGRRLAEFAVEQKERLLRAVTDNLSVLAMYVDRDETVRFLNATGADWLDTDRDAALDRPLAQVLGAAHHAAVREGLQRALAGEAAESELQTERRGRPRHLHVVYNPDRQADGSVAGTFVMVTDVTSSKEIQRQLETLARVDPLTGLPNRRQFDEKLDEALRRCHRRGQRLALMFLDIDHFKSINDSLGHAGGDAVLKEFGARLKRAVRETDVVARLAGDEFVVLLEGLAADEDASTVAEKIVRSMREDFDIGGVALRVTTSLGVGVAGPEKAVPPTASGLMICADRALYEAKREGRDGFRMSSYCELAAAYEPAAL